jgi:Di-haem oxidoreductase, putative peroxidase
LRKARDVALLLAKQSHHPVSLRLNSKGINYGEITGNPDGSVDTARVKGVDPDLRVRPFFAEGSTMSIREFIVGALHNEMGLSASADPDLLAANAGAKVITPSGMVLDGTKDKIDAPPAPDPIHGNEVEPALVDYLEFYLLNYFKPAQYKQDDATERGQRLFREIGCSSCHVPNLTINHDRRVADVETVYDPVKGNMNSLFATAFPLIKTVDDGTGNASLKQPLGNSFLVRNIFTDFKRHDLGPNFYERNWDGTMQTLFMTRALWGIASSGPYGHDGRSITLNDVILRHGGEAQRSRDAYAGLSGGQQDALTHYLNSFVLFPPDDTASTLDPGNRNATGYPQYGHGSIKLTVLFNDPADPE